MGTLERQGINHFPAGLGTEASCTRLYKKGKSPCPESEKRHQQLAPPTSHSPSQNADFLKIPNHFNSLKSLPLLPPISLDTSFRHELLLPSSIIYALFRYFQNDLAMALHPEKVILTPIPG